MRITVKESNHLFEGIPPTSMVWMSHGDIVNEGADDWLSMAHSDYNHLCAVRHKKRPIYAVQFHPEVVHTEHGKAILKNFILKICGCQGDWKMESFVDSEVRRIREQVGKDKVICGLSGGVDSTVVATLIHKAIGPQLTCVFVNNGVLRKDEAPTMVKMFRDELKFNLRYVDAEKRFLNVLKGVRDPERKRKLIGHEFIKVFSAEARRLKGAKFLAQGTLYPDLIESRSAFGGPTSKIKTHHNVGGLPKDLKFKLIEPLKYLFKDEVREIARTVGISESFWRRQPFPGPGLAVRIIGDISKDKLNILREADSIVRAEVETAGFHKTLWQYFAVLLPVRSVGVMGDARTYENVIAVRAVESQDGMTADWARLPPEVLEKISSRITNEVKGVNRVVYDISSKPPSTIEWE
jgi:GMP synthase (glutamine-hydrolysing)